MNHRPFREWMHAVLDGASGEAALTPGARRELEAHLATCGECQVTWAALSEVQRLFALEPMAAPRPGFTGRFQARLAQRQARPRVIWGAVALGLGAVGAAALVVPLGLGLIVSAVRVAQQPATALALAASLSAAVEFFDTVAGALYLAVRALVETTAANPLAWAAGALALGLTVVWLVLMRNLMPEVTAR